MYIQKDLLGPHEKRPRTLLTTPTSSLSYRGRQLVLEEEALQKVVDGWATPGVKPQVHNITVLLFFEQKKVDYFCFGQLIYH